MKAVISILAVFALTTFIGPANAFAPPPSNDDEPEVIELYNVIDERADRLAEEFALDDQNCPNELRSAPIVLPVTDGDRLVGYAFATPRFCLARGYNRFQMDESMHFIVDRMIREAHRTPYAFLGNNTIDKTAANEALLRVAREIIGEERIERLDLLGSDVRYLR
ncbi:hypothetical protein NHF40_04875 [Maricaulaceae bacterium EIL42A08]|nr:hypothetical protein [Maricaulaceae bacterium EIL42A08]